MSNKEIPRCVYVSCVLVSTVTHRLHTPASKTPTRGRPKTTGDLFFASFYEIYRGHEFRSGGGPAHPAHPARGWQIGDTRPPGPGRWAHSDVFQDIAGARKTSCTSRAAETMTNDRKREEARGPFSIHRHSTFRHSCGSDRNLQTEIETEVVGRVGGRGPGEHSGRGSKIIRPGRGGRQELGTRTGRSPLERAQSLLFGDARVCT